MVERPEDVEPAVADSLAHSERLAAIRTAIAHTLFYNTGKATEAASAWFVDRLLS